MKSILNFGVVLCCVDLKETNWGALMKTIPAMFALTFFGTQGQLQYKRHYITQILTKNCLTLGILHVPINVPALGVSINEDNVNTNRELVAHGLSNMFSGFAGSVQSKSTCPRKYCLEHDFINL